MRAALVAALVAGLLTAPAAQAKTEVATAGTIRAEFSYKRHGDKPPTELVQRIFDNGQLIVENRLPDDQFLYPGGFADESSVKAIDLDGTEDGKAEVIFDVYTGGAHCCLRSDIYKGRSHFTEDWGNVGYRLEDFDGDGRPEFRTADDFFSGAYTAYAFSQQPLKVLKYAATGSVDFTRDESVRPALRREAASMKRTYRKRRDRKGIVSRQLVISSLAAYAADQCSLGRCAKGYALIRKAVARGDVKQFSHLLRTVRKDLRKLGYDR